MTKEKRFLKHLGIASVTISLLMLALMTWTDPYRNLNMPWQSSFISDRNVAYKRFKLLEKSTPITDLVVGSSTCEAFQPQFLKTYFGVTGFNAGMPAATTHLRYIMIKAALRSHPELKRIIYIADLFEFKNFNLPTKIYYQPELKSFLDSEDLARIPKPTLKERFHDVFSDLVFERSVATLNDLRKNWMGTYRSRFHPDGGTDRTMIVVNPKDPVEVRAANSAIGLNSVYKQMSRLDPNTLWMFQKIVKLVEASPGVELHLVISPFHPVFFDHFKTHFENTHIYADWVAELKALGQSPSGRIHVHDFSYPEYFAKGVKTDSEYWVDGLHFTLETVLKIGNQIYGQADLSRKNRVE